MFCPNNFNTIDIGDSIEKVIKMCGNPDYQTQYQEVITLSQGVSYNQSTGSYYDQSQGNYNYQSGNIYGQSLNSSQSLNDVKKKIIIITKYTYSFPQPATLIFEDGLLKDRILNGMPHLK